MTVEEIHAPPDFDGSEGLLAMVVSGGLGGEGTCFLTDRREPLQVARMARPAGDVVAPHRHWPRRAQSLTTQEVLFVLKGRLRADFFTSAGVPVCSRFLGPGDVLVLLGGGHGLECLEDVDLWEVKTGPYPGRALDKSPLPPPPGAPR